VRHEGPGGGDERPPGQRPRWRWVCGAAAAAAILAPAQVGVAATMSSGELRKVLNAEPLPTRTLLPTTSTSHPWDGAAWQTTPIRLGRYGFVEDEYLLSGTANVYGWVPRSNYETTIQASGAYTTQMDIRRPKDMRRWSGRVVVEISNMSSGYNFAAIWSAIWQRVVKRGDVFIGITSKPNVIPGLLRFDAQRYSRLSFANPVPADQQACGSLPTDPDYNPNLSKLYENGLIWDVLTQVGRSLKTTGKANPLGRPASRVYLSGESQSSGFLETYYKWFTPAALLPTGKPVYDGILSETLVGRQAPINQCANVTTPLAADDPQNGQIGRGVGRSVPWMEINSQWDYPAARGYGPYRNSNSAHNKARFWELAGANHGWAWQYKYGDASEADLAKAGFDVPSSYDWQCTVNNPEVPLYMAEKAAYEALDTWVRNGTAPSIAPPIVTKPIDPSIAQGTFRDAPYYDAFGNAMGGLRLPMVAVPVASFGPGQYALSGSCPQIAPFAPEILGQLYRNRGDYIARYQAVTAQLVEDGFILPEDVRKLNRVATRVTTVSAGTTY
jgi:Alpha/beta hydrolase domain